MSEIKQITSLQNTLVREILVLKEKSRERRKKGLFVLEGRRELQLALKGGYEVVTLLYCPEIMPAKDILEMKRILNDGTTLIELSPKVYQKLAYRATTEGLIAVSKTKDHSLTNLALKNRNPLILVAEAPEKPGNIGALLRTADAANLDAVFIANAKGDIYNPNIIRSSVGCIFTNSIAMGSTSDIISYLKEHDISIFCAALTASKNYTNIDYTKGSAIVVGTESTGLTYDWLENSDQNIVIPMQGEIDSMNVSVSAAILIFEAKRQRDFSTPNAI
ncbi:TrmH family RNA methyltransferase [Maribacter algicola]|uniref:TrmH family RNA methyltransferase n=1 Tax=Meishania litoralis TaxID=3434685 RepID=A0ACC7LMQ5_9FLAO